MSVLAVVALVSSLLGIPSASAADPVGTVALFPNMTAPAGVEPITRTSVGDVWWQDGNTVVIDGTWGRRQTWFPGRPHLAGDLLSFYYSPTRYFYYETISTDASLNPLPFPADLTYLASTSTGYLAQRGTGPYELVSVDVLHGTDPVVIATTTVSQTTLQTSSAGVLARGAVAGQYLYFPNATPGSVKVLQAPLNSRCTLASSRLYCVWSDGTTTHLTRLPLTGAAGDRIDANPSQIVETSTGVAFSSVNGTTTTLWSWPVSAATPVRLLGGTFGISNSIAAAADDPSTVLVFHPGSLDEAGIYAVPISGSAPTLVSLTAESNGRGAWDVAIAPGEVAWVDNGYDDGWQSHGTELVSADLTGSSPGAQQVYPGVQSGDQLSLSGGLWTVTSGRDAILYDPRVDNLIGPLRSYPANLFTELSGDRLLTQSGVRGDLQAPWALNDLRTARTTALPAALSYDVWGERLARLDFDGSVWVLDLRTGGAPVQVRAPSANVSSGKVLIAGDMIAWQITSSAGASSTTETMVRNLATMSPAGPIPGLTKLVDLSTGYAVGSTCSTTTDCRTAAVSLSDGSTTTFDPPASGTNHYVAVDGNNVAFVTTSGVASVFALPAYADQSQLLGLPAAPATSSALQPWTAHFNSSRVLDSCQIEIRDAAHTLVRTLSCLDPHGAATVTWDDKNTAGAVVPDGAYTWRIVGATAGRPLTDYDGSTTALSGAITVLPVVTGHSPATNSMAVSQATNVTATFSAPVTGVSGTTFVLKNAAGTTVPASVTYNSTTRTATLDPTATLATDTSYTATLTGGASAIHDAVNRPVPTQSWSFITGPAPQLIAYSPLNGAGPAVSTNITATFSEPVQRVDADTFTLVDSSSNAFVPATVTYDPTTRTATLNPDADLRPDGHYVAWLNNFLYAISDGAGNRLLPKGWNVTTGPAPTITARTPAVNATGAKTYGNIYVTFSEPVQGVSGYSVRLTSAAGTPIPGLVSYNPTNRTITLNPFATLARNTRYRAEIVGGPMGITDLAGNNLTGMWWYFTTGAT